MSTTVEQINASEVQVKIENYINHFQKEIEKILFSGILILTLKKESLSLYLDQVVVESLPY